MRFSPLLIAGSLLAVGAFVSMQAFRSVTGVAADDSWQLAVIHAELVIASFLFLPIMGLRGNVLTNLATAVACWIAASAVVLLFGFAAVAESGWSTRPLSLAAWTFATGCLALGARGNQTWITRARVGVVAVFSLPVLWHYLMLEYASASALHLRALSPNWMLATGDVLLWPLFLLGGLAWLGATAWPDRTAV